MESANSLEISVDLGNLPHLLKTIAETMKALQSRVDEINNALRKSSLSPFVVPFQKYIRISMKVYS
jgi:hypothetical protein